MKHISQKIKWSSDVPLFADLEHLVMPEPNTGCWIWCGSKFQKQGYGRYKFAGNTIRAHRGIYEMLVGKIADGLTIDHMCNNPICVNPLHLSQATIRDNVLRSSNPFAINKRKTHCYNGHELSGKNLIERNGGRGCRECRRATSESRRRAKGASTRGPYKNRMVYI